MWLVELAELTELAELAELAALARRGTRIASARLWGAVRAAHRRVSQPKVLRAGGGGVITAPELSKRVRYDDAECAEASALRFRVAQFSATLT